MKSFLILFAIMISLTLKAQTKAMDSTGSLKSPSVETKSKTTYTYTIIPSKYKTWGYDIYIEKRLFIHQPSIPGLPGNEGFKIKADADKVARLVIKKIKKGEMPPSVTIEEMNKLKAL